MFRKVVAIAAIGLTALALSSCDSSDPEKTPSPSPSTVNSQVILGGADIWDGSNQYEGVFELNVLRIADLQSGEVIIGGSSSCPPVPTGATYEDGLLEVELSEEDSDRICTMDLRQYGISVELQEGEWDLQTKARVVQGDRVTDLEVIWPEENSDEDAQ